MTKSILREPNEQDFPAAMARLIQYALRNEGPIEEMMALFRLLRHHPFDERLFYSLMHKPKATMSAEISLLKAANEPGCDSFLVVSSYAWRNITADRRLALVIEPVSEHDVMLTGHVAYLNVAFGKVPILTDHFAHARLRQAQRPYIAVYDNYII